MRLKEGKAILLPQAEVPFLGASGVRKQALIVFTVVRGASISPCNAFLFITFQGWNGIGPG